MNKYECSNGKKVSQATINKNLSIAYRYKHEGNMKPICECCGAQPATDNDHTISQRRCKELRMTELIWDPENFVSSCRECHREWEEYKSGLFKLHINYEHRMLYLRDYDIEAFHKRMLI